MHLPAQIATQLRGVYFGGNWTDVNFKDSIAGVDWQQATTKVYDLNTIATLVFHTNYYVAAVLKVLQGGPLESKDIYSFTHPPVNNEADWQQLVQKSLTEAETFAVRIEQLPPEQLWDDLTEKKYGSYYRNLHGIIEHVHYHLGQIVLIRKILNAGEK